jgi:hypothetical protein
VSDRGAAVVDLTTTVVLDGIVVEELVATAISGEVWVVAVIVTGGVDVVLTVVRGADVVVVG